jgi:Uncharacterized protein conserved in bacteria (DUF2325)
MPASELPRMLEAGLDLAIDAAPESSLPMAERRARSARRRVKIWEIQSSWLCSIIGTCLSPGDVDRILRRAGVRFKDGAQAYDIHGFMVVRASEQGRVGREINKTLDEKYAAILRKVGGEQDGERLAALWDDLCARGLVAGAYWAIMSHAHVAEELKVHAFGEVHMLSHFMGGHNRHAARELWAAERRMQQLADRLARARRQGQETIAARDQRIGALEQELKRTRYELIRAYAERARRPAALPSGARQRRGERRLAAARARMHALEGENQRLKALLGVLTDATFPGPEAEPEPVAAAAEPEQIAAAAEDGTAPPEGRCVLYVGGRCQLLPHLRARAAACNACLLHHDGGQEETLQSLGGLVDRADVVFCPIDCVSHQACLKVKSLCRRRAKPFVPLRSSSATCFSQAMKALRRIPTTDGHPDEPLRVMAPMPSASAGPKGPA